VLLVGLGYWGTKHLRVLRELDVDVWVAELMPARREWAVAQGLAPGRVVADFRHALPQVDAVDVVTGADRHAPIAAVALGAGRHCFVEKPLAVTAAEGRMLAATARASGRVLQVGHIFRFHPVTAALKRALDADRIGRVRFATGRFSGFKRPRTDVGITHTDSLHYFDLFAYLFRCRATRVTALQRDFLGRGLDDMSVTLVSYGDIDTIVEANYFVPTTQRECTIVGDRGSLVADYGANAVTLHAGWHERRAEAWEAIVTGKEDLPTVGREPLRAELEAFRAACAGSAASPVSPEDGVHALEVSEAATRAATLGGAVVLGG
jgi:predicted dehydrogenase